MANELVHGSVGVGMTQAEFEAVGLHVLNSQATGDLIYASSATQLSRLGVGTNGDLLTLSGGIPAWSSNKTTTFYINDTANTGMTLGLTINQGANDNEILALKSSDVAHGITDIGETDTFGQATKAGATTGGLQFRGLSSSTVAIYLTGYGTTDNTAKTTAALGYVHAYVGKRSGTTVTNAGADANLMVISDLGNARFIFDVEGSGHSDVGWVTYDKYNDLEIISDIESELVAQENESKTERRHALESLGIIGKDSWHKEKGQMKAMVNFTKLAMLHHGALLQVHARLDQIENRLQLIGG